MDELENLDFSQQDKQTYDLDLEAAQQELQNSLEATPNLLTPEQAPVKDQGFLPDNPVELIKEAGKAAIGGTTDAIDSVGSFGDLVGDTAITAVNSLFGVEDTKNNPFHENYEQGAWWDIPDHMVPENASGLGKLTRGLVEFGVLASVTGGLGGGYAGATKLGVKLAKGAVRAGQKKFIARTISYIPKGAKVASEGAIADLISSSSEMGNIANLVHQYAPFIPFSQALAIDPERDNPWLARIKTMAAGAGLNVTGDVLIGTIRGAWAAAKEFNKTGNIELANIKGTAKAEEYVAGQDVTKKAHDDVMKAKSTEEGKGIVERNYREEYNQKHLDEDDFAEWKSLTEGGDLSPYMISFLRKDNAGFNADMFRVEEGQYRGIESLNELAERIGNRKKDPWVEEKGASTGQIAEDATREPDPFVNPDKFNLSEKSSHSPNKTNKKEATREMIEETVINNKRGENSGSSTIPMSEADVRTASTDMGSDVIYQYLKEGADEIGEMAFKQNVKQKVNAALPQDGKIDTRRFSQEEVTRTVLEAAEEMYGQIADGGLDSLKNLQAYFKNKDKYIDWSFDKNNKFTTGTPEMKAALMLLINSLGRKVADISTGAMDLPQGMSRYRAAEQVYDLMQIIMVEQKKIGYLTGNALLQNKLSKQGVVGSFTADERLAINKGIEEIVTEQRTYFDELKRLAKEGRSDIADDLLRMHQHSGGIVTTQRHMHDYLRALVSKNPLGSEVNGIRVTPRYMNEMRSVYYNSLLSRFTTPIKAVFSTNMITMLRPMQAYVGAMWRGDKKEMLVAAAAIDSIGNAWAESLAMWKHNWDLGVNRQTQTYAGKFSVEDDLAEFGQLAKYYGKYGTDSQKRAYGLINGMIIANTSPLMRYSQNIMGSGDAFARTLIGRMEMRMRAARKAIEDGINPKDVTAWAAKHEEAFRNEIFVRDKHKMFVVSDKAASLAGDEAAMTKALPDIMGVFDKLSQLPGGMFFFPFVRTGYNAIRLSFAHTELNRFTRQFDDIMKGKNLAEYGIRKQDLAQAQALMRGRMNMGNSIVGLTALMSMQGLITGDLPYDKETRDQWRLSGIQANSFKVGNTYVSYRNLEPFNTIFAAVANFATHRHVLGEDMFDDMFQKSVWMTSALIVDKSMLSGVSDLAVILNADTGLGGAQRAIARLSRGILPYAGLMGGLGDIMNANEREAVTFLEQIRQKDLFFKQTIPPKYDIFSKDRSGVPYQAPPNNPFLRMLNGISPIAIVDAGDDPVKQAMVEINYNLPDAVTQYKGERLTSKERSELQRYMSMDSQLRANLERIIGDKSWQDSLENYRERGFLKRNGEGVEGTMFYRAVHREIIRAKARAIEQLRADNTDLNARLKLREAKKNALKYNEFERVDYLINEFPK